MNTDNSYFLKRSFDIVGALIGLILFSPVMLIIFIIMKIKEPKSPFFFSQTRIGKNEKPFKIYKIRTMEVNAESKLSQLMSQNEVKGPMFKMKEDPRVTKVGKVLRKTSLDEIPQLINVLKGDMSLVGPRPPLPREVDEYTDYQKKRLAVKPGCTGLWQVSGRSELSFDEMVALDLDYIKNQSLWLDIKIILKTIKVMIFRSGAY